MWILHNVFNQLFVKARHQVNARWLLAYPRVQSSGPLLFLLHINDLPDTVQSSVSSLRTMLYFTALSLAMRTVTLLQSDLRRLESWQYYWQMEFNPSKCKIVTISHKNNPPQRKYVFCGVELEQVDTLPYLGVTISNKLKWSAHVSITAAKASKSLGTIQRNLWNCPKKVKEIACTSLVRPSWNMQVRLGTRF